MSRRSPSAEGPGGDPERDALAWLARRPLTEVELRGKLEAAGYACAAIDRTCRKMRDIGTLDDRKLAEHYIVTRAERLGHGRERLIAELARRGLSAQVAAAAWDALESRGDLSSADLLARRLGQRLAGRAPLDRRAWAREARALQRAGFSPQEIVRQLEPFRAAGEPAPEAVELEEDHDLA